MVSLSPPQKNYSGGLDFQKFNPFSPHFVLREMVLNLEPTYFVDGFFGHQIIIISEYYHPGN